jgi:hypothetical protein
MYKCWYPIKINLKTILCVNADTQLNIYYIFYSEHSDKQLSTSTNTIYINKYVPNNSPFFIIFSYAINKSSIDNIVIEVALNLKREK